jgi:hypothetical protein
MSQTSAARSRSAYAMQVLCGPHPHYPAKNNVSEELQGPLPEGGRQGLFGGEVFVELRGLLYCQ